MRVVPATPQGIEEAATAIRAGQVVAYPTETVYGLGVDPFSEAAVERLFEAKSRERANPVLLIVADDDQLRTVVAHVSAAAAACAQAFWPGPLSILFPKSERLAASLTAGHDKVGVRRTACATAAALCKAAGGAITSSSANVAGQAPARSAAEVDLPGIAVCVDGGALPPGPPSTVFDPDTGVVLREGAITEAQLHALRQYR